MLALANVRASLRVASRAEGNGGFKASQEQEREMEVRLTFQTSSKRLLIWDQISPLSLVQRAPKSTYHLN